VEYAAYGRKPHTFFRIPLISNLSPLRGFLIFNTNSFSSLGKITQETPNSRALIPLPLIVIIISGTVGNMQIQFNKSDLVLLPATMFMIVGCAQTRGAMSMMTRTLLTQWKSSVCASLRTLLHDAMN
jgi:hypothetical protein